jgi:hypothetical protein
MRKTQIFNQLLNPPILVCLWYFKFQSRCESHRFSNSKISENDIVLHNVICKPSEYVLVEFIIVIEQNISL